MANYLARVAAAGARTTSTVRPTATPFPPLFRRLIVPRPHIEAAPAEEESNVSPARPHPGGQPARAHMDEAAPSPPNQPETEESVLVQRQPAPGSRGPAPTSTSPVAAAAMPLASPEVVRVRAPRLAPQPQPGAPVTAIAPPARVVAPGVEGPPVIASAVAPLPVTNPPGHAPMSIGHAADPDIAPPPGVPATTLPMLNDATPQPPAPWPPGLSIPVPAPRHDPGWPAPPAEAVGRQRGEAASRITIGTVDVRVVNAPPPGAAVPPAPVPASAPEAPALTRFRLRP